MSPLKTCLRAAIACAVLLATHAHAQSDAAGPVATHAGTVYFLRDESGFAAMLGTQAFDRFDARRLAHFDEAGESGTITRTLMQTDTGPVLYDFRRNPPLVQRAGKRMTVQRVFWQGDEVVMQTTAGRYKLERGALTKLQSSTKTYH
ncbi:conserved exported hypothetical protein [Burkholderia sp. 8Y]|uniref:hypothetical protein n=1 Tax=Burkholderia sp. 8Y TaxID=2653133 RepID=UPI0012F10C0E|nr:hypothetical protein [Burkholderia sp. 8Y]VXB61474.1 conserved exported hypothetical protein [Burkholderia sp. 8Y]